MGHAIPLWTPPALPVAGSGDSFPVRRIFCVGRNYAEHQKEMGGDGREQPFFFIKSAHSLVAGGGEVRYPPKTANYHYETELVVALGKGGRRIDAKRANDHIFGYAVGLESQPISHLAERFVRPRIVPLVRQPRLIRVAVDRDLLRRARRIVPRAAFGKNAGVDEVVVRDGDV